jgi:hypothetical protein
VVTLEVKDMVSLDGGERTTIALLSVINHGDHPVKLASVGLEKRRGGGYAFARGLPAEVPAHDRRGCATGRTVTFW